MYCGCCLLTPLKRLALLPSLLLSSFPFLSVLEFVIVVQSLSHVWLSATPWTAAHQASHPSPSPGACSNSCPLSRWCYSTISSSVVLFSCLQSFLASGSFPMSWLFESGGQSTGASASVLSMNIQCWFPLGFTGLTLNPIQRLQGLHWWIIWKRICLHFRRAGFDPWVGKSPWRREWQPTPVFLPG